jgi:phage tail protein X
MQAIAQAGEMVDELCWRTLGRTAGVVEQILELNGGLAALGPRLPEGTIVELPEIGEAARPGRETVQLWD